MVNSRRSLKNEKHPITKYNNEYIYNLLDEININNKNYVSIIDFCKKKDIKETTLKNILNGYTWQDISNLYCLKNNILLSDIKNKLKSNKFKSNKTLTSQQIKEIRSSNNSSKELSKIYNVSIRAINNIKSFKTWKTLV
jgi:hypothetical protein